MLRLTSLAVFSGGPLAAAEPEFKLRRASKRPRRLGFAVPAEHRISVTVYPGAEAADLLETLLHELVHLHVGRQPGGRAWHGAAFQAALARAMEEAYGVSVPRVRATTHGAYAAAIGARIAAGEIEPAVSASPVSAGAANRDRMR